MKRAPSGNDILGRIVEDTRALVAARKQSVPDPASGREPSAVRPFRPTLTTSDLAVIAEIKQASPTAGVIRPDMSVEMIAKQYEEAGAAAISVLTEPTHFKGDLAYIEVVKDSTALPVLRKDFILDEYQVIEARAYGADAVLLIATILDAPQLADLHDVAAGLGMDCLVEIYDPSELDRCDLDQISILGVNNRNLTSFDVDITHSFRVFETVPESITKVSESGFKTTDHFAEARRNGVNAVLIGETLMRASHPGNMLENLLRGS